MEQVHRVRRKSQLEPTDAERFRKKSSKASVFTIEEETETSSRRASRASASNVQAGSIPRKKRPSQTAVGYYNAGYAGSVSSMPSINSIPNNTVYREQYCSCARWTRVQQFLLIAVGVLAGAVCGLIILVSLKSWDPAVNGGVIGGSLRHSLAEIPALE